jgi:predicted protein tyrosine phosphatase
MPNKVRSEIPVIPVQILSRYDLAQKIELGERVYSHCISITDPAEAMPSELLAEFRETLQLQFHDIERRGDMPGSRRPRLVRRRHLKRVLRFYNRTRASATGYTVHCHAGVHRSTAVGLALLYLELGSEAAAAEELLRLKPLPMPNRRMVRLLDSILGSDLARDTERLWSRARDFLDGNTNINSDDYLDELESAE